MAKRKTIEEVMQAIHTQRLDSANWDYVFAGSYSSIYGLKDEQYLPPHLAIHDIKKPIDDELIRNLTFKCDYCLETPERKFVFIFEL